MTDYNLGRVGIVLKGAYSVSTAYKRLDMITYEGRSYIALQDSIGITPINIDYWQKATFKGKGYNPRGTWTALATYTNDLETIDVVSHNGVSYYCVVSHTGQSTEPDLDTTNWGVLVVLGNATSITLTDADEYYDATNVEGALKEEHENVKANADAISGLTDDLAGLAGDGRTTETVKDNADDIATLVSAVGTLETDVDGLDTDSAAHKTDTMPHQFADLKNTKTYKFGFQLSTEGNPQIIYEEVV